MGKKLRKSKMPRQTPAPSASGSYWFYVHGLRNQGQAPIYAGLTAISDEDDMSKRKSKGKGGGKKGC